MQLTRVATGVVEAVLVTPERSRKSVVQDQIKVDPHIGVFDDRHSGDRYVDMHDSDLVAMGVLQGTHCANARQVTLVSRHELDLIEQSMGLPWQLPVGCLAENIVMSGIDFMSEELKPGTQLEFRRHPDDPHPCAVLGVWQQNTPCAYPEQTIVEYFTAGGPPFEPAMPFVKAARGRRGVVGFVLVGGSICPGDTVTVWQ